jgi:hypothetical protein
MFVHTTQVLNVAEKNDAAKNIAQLLSRGNTTQPHNTIVKFIISYTFL